MDVEQEPDVQVEQTPDQSWVLKPECRSPYPAPLICLSDARTTLDLGSRVFHLPYELATEEHVTVGLFLEATARWQAVNKNFTVAWWSNGGLGFDSLSA